MTFEFDRAIRLASDDGRVFTGEIVDGWDINGNANGGYLLALVGSAMREASGRGDPVTLTAHYLAPGKAGPITVETDVVKTGRQFVTMTGSLRSGDREILRALGSFGDLAAMSGGFEHIVGGPPDLPPAEECSPRNRDTGAVTAALMDRLRVGLRPGDAGFQVGEKSGRAVVEGWFAFADDRPIDSLAVLLATDAFPPSVFNLEMPVGWVPTVELTVHVRGVPAPGPLACRFHSDFIRNGFLNEDTEIWDSAGKLVAQSRQLALVPRAAP